MEERPQKHTGWNRQLKTRFSVKVADRLAWIFITFGGLATIAAVSLVCVFLVWVVLPLFTSSSVSSPASTSIPEPKGDPVAFGIDE